MKNFYRRVLSGLMAFLMVLTVMPMATANANIEEGAVASLSSIGYADSELAIPSDRYNTTLYQDVGWLETYLGEDKIPVFCKDLGKGYNTGLVYSNHTNWTDCTPSMTSRNGQVAYVIAWALMYNKNRKIVPARRWPLAQALLWGITESNDALSATELKAIIRQMINHPVGDLTSYPIGDAVYSSDVQTIYNYIFAHDFSGKTVTASYRDWDCGNSRKQGMREIKVDIEREKVPTVEKEYTLASVTESTNVRQEIDLTKVDDTGARVNGAEFTLKLKNPVGLTRYSVYTFGDNLAQELYGVDAVTDTTKVAGVDEITYTTDYYGMIYFVMTYEAVSKKFSYINSWKGYNSMSDAIKAAEKEEGITVYATEAEAQSAAKASLETVVSNFKRSYTLTETSTAKAPFVVNESLSQNLVVGNDHTWKVSEEGTTNKTGLSVEMTNKRKMYTVHVVKKDSKSADGKAHGDASLAGAKFQIYTDEACTKIATVYTEDKTPKICEGYVTDENGMFETDYLTLGRRNAMDRYYLKEIEAPVGYEPNDTVYDIKLTNIDVTLELSNRLTTVTVEETPILGSMSLTKNVTNIKKGTSKPEEGATFELYLKSKGSYDACSDYERDILTTDENGNATSKDLYFGTYILHQTGSGNTDSDFIADQTIEINKDSKNIQHTYDDKQFTAYLKIEKKSAQTNKTILKAGTTYNIYKIDDNGELTKVVETYTDKSGNQVKTDTYTCDASGFIETYSELESGKYRIIEIAGPNGTHITDNNYVDITIHSSNTKDYTKNVDARGNVYYEVTVSMINEETPGVFTLEKTGTSLSSYSESNGFVYSPDYIKGATFKLYADEDIYSADTTTLWFSKGDLVATIVSGESVIFEKSCGGLCDSTVYSYGSIKIQVPLGKYTITETETKYGYLLGENTSYNLEFVWDNDQDTFVANSTEATNMENLLSVENDRAKASVSITKVTEGNENLGVPNTVFDFYTKDDIYNADNVLIVKADTKLATVTTDKNGYASIDLDLPMMSQGYAKGVKGLNSGDYYFVESSVSDSYFLDKTPINVHLEYKDSATAEIKADMIKVNAQTEVEIDKLILGSNKVLNGADLKLTDSSGETLITWTTGYKDSVVISNTISSDSYENLSATINDEGNIIIKGLLHDEKYTLSEVRPANGYVTADSIEITITEENKSEPLVVSMYDDTTKFKISKKSVTGEDELEGCILEIKDEDGNVIDTWTSTSEAHYIEGELIAEGIYTLTEKLPVNGYTTATSITFNVRDTGEVQTVTMTDQPTKVEISKTTITGEEELKGCNLEVIRKDTNETIDAWTSTSERHLIEGELIIGKTYILRETRPADGYVTATDIEFVVEDLAGTVQTVHMVDEETHIKLIKVDAASEETCLEGAEFDFIDKNGNTVASVTTDKDGIAKVDGKLAVNETYTVKETKAPEGYELAEDTAITVKDTKDSQEIKIGDKKISLIVQTGFPVKTTLPIFALFLVLAAVILVIRNKVTD